MSEYHGFVYSSLREIIEVLFRHKGKILATFILVVAIVTVGVYVWPPTYRSEADLMLRVGRENLPTDPAVENTLMHLAQDRTNEVRSIMAVISSDEIARQTVASIGEGWILDNPSLPRKDVGIKAPDYDKLTKKISRAVSGMLKDAMYGVGLKERLGPTEEAVQRLQNNLTVDMERQSNIVKISYDASSPSLAQAVLKQVIAHYLKRHEEIFASQVAPSFFEDKVKGIETDLGAREKALQDFKNANNLPAVQAQKENLLKEIASLQGELSDQQSIADGLEAMVNALQQTVKGRAQRHELQRTSGMTNAAGDALKDKLITMRVKENELSAHYTDNYRPLQELRHQMALVQEQLKGEAQGRTEVVTGIDANVEGLKNRLDNEGANLASAKARMESLRVEITRLKEELSRVAGTEMQLASLERARDLAEKEYKDDREKLQKSNLSASLDKDNVTNVRTVQEASAPLEPVSPKKPRTIGLGLLLGLFLGIALAFVLDYFDDTLKTPDDVERWVKLPVLASLSERDFRKCT